MILLFILYICYESKINVMVKRIVSLFAIAAIVACKPSKNNEALKETETVSQTKKEELIPNDPAVKTGTLSNGLKYYIQNNGKPAEKVELRLVVNAGSVLEDDNQQGLAHFMEHMCFNGTKNFKKNELVDYLQSIGVKFGADLNAYTSFDETVYILPIPSGDGEKLEKGFQILEDWAFNALLTDEEIDNERGIVLEEYRSRDLNASTRMRNKYFPKLLNNSKYVERLPIGKPEIIENFKPEVIRKFYKDWYRPDLMAVVAVGDVDVSVLEAKIKSHFGKYAKAENPRKKEIYTIQNHDETFIAIESDKEATANQVQLIYMNDENSKPEQTISDARNTLVEGLYSQMINARLGELRNKPTPPFVYGYTQNGSMGVGNKDAYQSTAMVAGNDHLTALKALVEENERVKRYGFQYSELERAKKTFMAYYEKAYENKDKMESRQYVQAYIDNYLKNESMQSIEWSYNFAKKELPTITVNEINDLIKSYIKETNRVIVITGKEKTTTENEVLNLLETVKTSTDIKPYKDTKVQESLFVNLPKKGTITNESINENLGIKTLTLSNGAKISYKITDFKNDEVLFGCQSYGGTSLMTNENYLAANLALRAVPEAGIAGLNKTDLQKFMTGKIANVTPYIGNDSEGMNGSATPKDLETLFQLINLNFTSINKDEAAFKSYATKQKSIYGNLLANPQYFFINEFGKFQYGKNPRYTGFPSSESFDETNYDLAYTEYKERFANAADFNFYFVGAIDENKLKEYAKQYIASLPANDSRENFKDSGFRPLSGSHTKTIHKGNDPKSQVSIIYKGETTYNSKEALAMKAIGDILSIKMTEKLREEAQGVYSPRVYAGMYDGIYDSFSLNISFGCGPENTEKLKTIAIQEVENLIKNGPSEIDLNKAKEGYLVERKEQIKKNRFWLSQMENADFDKKDINKVLEFEKSVKAISTDDLKIVAEKYLSNGAIIGTLLPENI
jgi:zinc protease